MKTRNKLFYRRKSITAGLVLALASLLSSCGGGGDGGIIGTGMTIEGTVPTNRAFASNEVMLKAKTGERKSAVIGDNGRFSVAYEADSGPYLMKVDLGNNNAYYSVVHTNGGSVVQNIHGYSDVAIRNWYATQGLDIDSVFSGAGAIAQMPTQSQIDEINNAIRDQVELALEDYQLGATNLQTVVFQADDTGVDKFLDQNPVLISIVDGVVSITIIITSDPDLLPDGSQPPGTQSTVVQGLPLNTDLTANDVAPPSAPAGLRVLASASDEMVLVWDEAVDNIGVTAYEVTRDGAVVGTTPYPVFVDSPLQTGVTYTYTITALDATGNRSLPSQPGSSTTLDAPDTVAPPAPTGLQLSPGASSMDVRWVQSDIADVASFRVLRSIGNGMLDTRTQVTSTQLLDAGLNSGTNYCYQIVANDASMNSSNPGEKVCAVTGGSIVTAVVVVPEADDPVVPGPVINEPVDTETENTQGGTVGGNNEHLGALDVSTLSCTDELDVASVSGEARITEGCYLVNRDFNLGDTNLTIDAGVVLKFKAGTHFRVLDDASLSANGTREKPIVLTGQETTPGYWEGLDFSYSNNSKNSLTNVIVEYAGFAANGGAAVKSTANSSTIARVKMANVLMRYSEGYGFNFANGTLLDQFESITSTQNQQPGRVTPQLAGSMGSGLSLTGNAVDRFSLTNDNILQLMTLRDLGVPYGADNFDIEAPVDIAEGVTMVFDSGGRLNVLEEGSLRVSGTASNPVLFTADQATPGYWEGVEFYYTNSVNNELRHVTIEYGGAGSSRAANLLTTSLSSYPVNLKLDSVTLRYSANNGFHFNRDTTLGKFDNVVSTMNKESGMALPANIVSFGSGVDLTGNSFDRVTVPSVNITDPQSWPLLNVAILFDKITLNDALTLSAGQEMVAVAGGEIQINEEGSLSARGTAAAPITFQGEQQTPGYWKGIHLFFANSPSNVLDHVRISDGGSGLSSDSGNIRMTCRSSLPGNVSVSNAFISNSASWGILADDDGCVVNLGANVTFGNNMQGDILQ